MENPDTSLIMSRVPARTGNVWLPDWNLAIPVAEVMTCISAPPVKFIIEVHNQEPVGRRDRVDVANQYDILPVEDCHSAPDFQSVMQDGLAEDVELPDLQVGLLDRHHARLCEEHRPVGTVDLRLEHAARRVGQLLRARPWRIVLGIHRSLAGTGFDEVRIRGPVSGQQLSILAGHTGIKIC